MKRYYATVQGYTRPFVTDTGVSKGGEDLRLVLATKVGKESVDAVFIEAIGGRGSDGDGAACIVVKVRPGMKVNVVELSP